MKERTVNQSCSTYFERVPRRESGTFFVLIGAGQ
jgi:hypothetical protein